MPRVRSSPVIPAPVTSSSPVSVEQTGSAAGPSPVTDEAQFGEVAAAAALNPLVPAALQRATWDRVLSLAETVATQGKVPLIVVDHRLSGLDDRPILRRGLERLVQANNVTPLRDLDVAFESGALKFLPGYTEQASDAWRLAHADLVRAYPGVFGEPGTRIPLDFMSFSVREANATAGLADLEAALKRRTGGRGRLVFAGAGSGAAEDFASVYSRPVEQGGAGLFNPDVRHGSPSPSAAADERAQVFARAYESRHVNEGPVPLDHDSRGKAGWIETLEAEVGAGGAEQVVVAFADDRLHNRIAAQAAGKLGERMLAIKVAAPGMSVSALESDAEYQTSTFSPNP
jgi:hypothetical protein